MKRKSLERLGAVLGSGAAATAASTIVFKAWQRRWNATGEETARPLPLDDQVRQPTYVTNRAITVRARAEQIWPWIAQMGELPRGGFYSYVMIERLLKMKVVNADRILPEFQTSEVGAAIDRAGNMIVKAVEPNRVLVLGPPPMPDFDSTWAIALLPAEDGSTRLLSRCRARLPRGVKGRLMSLILDPGQFLMERKMLLEIKRRAEEHPLAEPAPEPLPEPHTADDAIPWTGSSSPGTPGLSVRLSPSAGPTGDAGRRLARQKEQPLSVHFARSHVWRRFSDFHRAARRESRKTVHSMTWLGTRIPAFSHGSSRNKAEASPASRASTITRTRL